MRWVHVIICLLLCGVSPSLPALAADLDGWRLVQLAPQEERAVFRAPDDSLQMLGLGDRLGERITFAGFDGEQVVLEKPGEWGRVTLFVSLIDGRQVVASRERQPLRKIELSSAPDSFAGAAQEGAVDPR